MVPDLDIRGVGFGVARASVGLAELRWLDVLGTSDRGMTLLVSTQANTASC
jgi:hypothetical protein